MKDFYPLTVPHSVQEIALISVPVDDNELSIAIFQSVLELSSVLIPIKIILMSEL